MNEKLKIIFAGTPEFAAQALKAILASNYDVIAVYTQPDRPAGRGRKLTPSAVKQVALESDIPVYQPVSLKDEEAQKELQAMNADVMVVAAYGLLLPKAILDAPKYGCLNIHGSILPRWRGAAPIQRAILEGDTETGITIMQMDVGLDTGDMLLKIKCPIRDNDTAETLHDKLAGIGASAIVSALDRLVLGGLSGEKQDDVLANYARKLEKAEAIIDWNKSAQEIDRQVRAFNPWPVAQTLFHDKVMRIWQAKPVDQTSNAVAGTIINADKNGLDVATGNGILRLTQIQLPGKKPMDVASFLNANDVTDVVLG
ncbi:MAG: methionyl-tRNA formyltransferase [Gammaproteobacteria bacterium]|nr:methionyl-tRNA formyltransferase [Gammaproteobacteria bacterium]